MKQSGVNPMGLKKSMVIHKWRCDASRTLEVTYRRCLQCYALIEVIIMDSYFIFRIPEVKYPGRGQARAGPDVASVRNSAVEEQQRVGGGALVFIR